MAEAGRTVSHPWRAPGQDHPPVPGVHADPSGLNRGDNTTILKGEAVSEVSKLKQQLDGDILVYASFHLVRALLERDLTDELRLMIYPVVLGAGKHLFGETSDKKPMRLTGNRTVGDDLVFLTYERIRDA